jgi:hypothetical protein
MNPHPPFCTRRHDLDAGPAAVHLSWSVEGTASAGDADHSVSVAAAQTADGTPAVHLAVSGVGVLLTLDEARVLVAAIGEMADRACWR